MANIKVHVLNFHSIHSHIEIVLENTSTSPHTYYGMNRWATPSRYWSTGGPKGYISRADSVFSFDIDADPKEITEKWIQYWVDTDRDASPLGKNCAVSTQWFLSEFAGVPKPNFSNVSWNHLALGIIWPSFIPCPITLPGRVMSNAKFHIEARNNPEMVNQYSRLLIYSSMALATLFFAATVFTLTACTAILSPLIAPLAVVGCAAAGIASTYAFFKAYNKLSAKNMYGDIKKSDEISLINQEENNLSDVSSPA